MWLVLKTNNPKNINIIGTLLRFSKSLTFTTLHTFIHLDPDLEIFFCLYYSHL